MPFKSSPRIIFNDDSVSLKTVPPPLSEKSVNRAVDYLIDTQVDWLCFEMFDWLAYSYRSNVIENFFDIMHRFLDKDPCYYDNVDPIGNANKGLEKNLPYFLDKKGIDYLPLLIDELHKNNISFFPSFRMNDCHMCSDPEGYLSPEFWKKNQQYRLWEVTDGFGYYNAALDYSYEEVRNYVIDAVIEVIDKYNIDGLELDFCRNPYVFQPSEAWRKRGILTNFIGGIKKLLNDAEKKKKKKLHLIVRVPFENEKFKNAGMDIKTWIQKKYIDTLVMSCRSNNYNISLEPWLTSCKKQNISFFPCIYPAPLINYNSQTHLPYNTTPPQHNYVVQEGCMDNIKRLRAIAQNYLAGGADGVYLFNHACKFFETQWSQKEFEMRTSILKELGSLKTLENKPKQYVFWHELPIYVQSSRPPEFHQTIKFFINENLHKAPKIVLSFRCIAEQNPHAYVASLGPCLPNDYMQIILNGKIIDEALMKKTLQMTGQIESGFHLGRHEKIEIHLKGEDFIYGENRLQFFIPNYPKDNDPYVYIYELTVDA